MLGKKNGRQNDDNQREHNHMNQINARRLQHCCIIYICH